MSVILAIESNQQQIAQLTAIVRGLGAELVSAKTAERALAALGDRVPDLILTPPLLLPKDEFALTDRLRELGTAALHVQMLSVPILASPSAPARDKRSLLRRGKDESVGCDPDVFGKQIAEYLERAVVERRELAASVEADLSTFARGLVNEPAAATPSVEADLVNHAANHIESDYEVGHSPDAETEPASALQLYATPDTIEDADAQTSHAHLGHGYGGQAEVIAAQRAAEKIVNAAVEARVAEEERAAQAAADAREAENRRAAAETAQAEAEAKALEAHRAAEQAIGGGGGLYRRAASSTGRRR